nr:hypothetical protein B0A51_01580 [Rachicladosporium sp. CCFEE 5018]
MLSKTKNEDRQPFEWMIDANAQDLGLLDFVRPNGSASYITVGDYRQLADGPFHAGTRSGSKAEYVDEANRLHFYVLDVPRDAQGVLHYVVGARSLDSRIGRAGVRLSAGKVGQMYKNTDSEFSTTCTFDLKNTGKSSAQARGNTTSYLQSDLYRLSVEVDGEGWQAVLPNEFASATFGESTKVKVAVGAGNGAARQGKVYLTAVFELDASQVSKKTCRVGRGY